MKNERCSENIFGIILNSKDNSPITDANVDIYFDGQNIETVHTNEKGEFSVYNVDCETDYTLISFKKDYKNIAKAAINTTELPDQIILLLEPNQEEEILTEETVATSPEENQIEQIHTPIIKEPKVETTNEVIVSTETKEGTTSSIPTKQVIPTSVTSEVSELAENTMSEVIEEKRPDYIPDVKSPEVVGKNIVLNPIYFELDEWYLTLSARRELDKIIVLMYLNKSMIVEASSHTDTRGPAWYNLELSEKRSQEAVGYLVANGVDPDRISGRGYGETMPLNRCVDGVRCTDREHLKNRRTEFIILKK